MLGQQNACVREKWHIHGRGELTFESPQLLRTRVSARILVRVSDVNPMAIADSGTSHAILPMNALHDDKSVKQVNLRLAAGEIAAVESQ